MRDSDNGASIETGSHNAALDIAIVGVASACGGIGQVRLVAA